MHAAGMGGSSGVKEVLLITWNQPPGPLGVPRSLLENDTHWMFKIGFILNGKPNTSKEWTQYVDSSFLS